ncbi:MAG: hypothetical protein QGH74_06610, partial [Candidatus Brocadiia bacterium]|nr:hypothetical protein [Candidatus Brocadiia bacterium]
MKGPIHNNQWADQSKEHETSYGEQFKVVTADLQEQGKLLERGIADPRPGAFEFLRVYPEKIRALQERLADSVDRASPRTIQDRERELLGLPGYPTESMMRKIEREYWIQEAIVSVVERTNEGLEDKILDFRPLVLRLEGKPEHFMRAAHQTRDFKCHVFQIGVTMVYEDVPAFLKELLDASLALEITSVNMELRGAGTSRTGAREPADVSGPMSLQGPDFGGGGVGPPGGLPWGGPGPMFDGGGVMDDGFTEPMD